MKIKTLLFCFASLSLLVSPAFADTVHLDSSHQGSGNKGTTFTPDNDLGNPANFDIKARYDINTSQPTNPNASGSTGTVFINSGSTGTGVKTISGGGGGGIQGSGPDRDEELIFTYNAPVLLYPIQLGLGSIDFGSGAGNRDDPYIYLQLSTDAPNVYSVVINESIIQSAFTSTGSQTGYVDFGDFIGVPSLSGLNASTLITGFKIRETNSEIYVTSLTEGIPAPEPGTLLILGSCLTYALARSKKQKNLNA